MKKISSLYIYPTLAMGICGTSLVMATTSSNNTANRASTAQSSAARANYKSSMSQTISRPKVKVDAAIIDANDDADDENLNISADSYALSRSTALELAIPLSFPQRVSPQSLMMVAST